MISNEALQEFKELYKKRFNKELDNKDALDKGLKILGIYKAVYVPSKQKKSALEITKEENDGRK